MKRFNSINIQYGNCLNPSNEKNRLAIPGSDQWGSGIIYPNCQSSLNGSVYGSPTIEQLGQNASKFTDQVHANYFKTNNEGVVYPYITEYTNTTLQTERPKERYSNYYVDLAAQMLNTNPDLVFVVFFSDENIEHLRTVVQQKVKEYTAKSGVAGSPEGVTINKPPLDDFFNYLLKNYQNYKVYNGSICFVHLKNQSDIKKEVSALNSNVLQEYVSKMLSQINMYIHYYKDASQIPEQLSIPELTSMKGSRQLEYNTGLYSGNFISGITQGNNIF
jgi:hypothetical protein